MRMKPLTLDLIEEGRFEQEVNQVLAKNQADLIEYVRKHGKEAAKGAKAVLQVNVILKFEGPEMENFSVKGELKRQLPARPAVTTLALADAKDDGEPSLFVRAAGSTADDPRQQVLCTEDGRTINPTTGEAEEANKTAAKK